MAAAGQHLMLPFQAGNITAALPLVNIKQPFLKIMAFIIP